MDLSWYTPKVRIVAIESSSRRGSVALLEGHELIYRAEHEQLNRHAELLLPLLERLLSEAGWARSSLDRLGVGVGPGSFTGLRAGIALAEGLSVGLDRPLIGVGSLQAMAEGALRGQRGPCCAVLDAKRDELFVAVYEQDRRESCPPLTVPRRELVAFLDRERVETVVGEVAREFEHGRALVQGDTLDLPHARWIGSLAADLDETQFPPEPIYVRGIGATLPARPRTGMGLDEA